MESLHTFFSLASKKARNEATACVFSFKGKGWKITLGKCQAPRKPSGSRVVFFLVFLGRNNKKSDSNEKTSDLRVLRPHKKFQNSVTILQHRPRPRGVNFSSAKTETSGVAPKSWWISTNPLMQQNWQNFTAKFVCVDYVTGFMKINKQTNREFLRRLKKPRFVFSEGFNHHFEGLLFVNLCCFFSLIPLQNAKGFPSSIFSRQAGRVW